MISICCNNTIIGFDKSWILHFILFILFFYFFIGQKFFFNFFKEIIIIFFIVVDFVIHWNETAMGLHVFPIPIPLPTSLSTRSL